MPVWLLINWRWALPTAALALALIWGSVGWWKYTGLRADYAEFKAATAKVAAEALDRARKEEQKNAELVGKINDDAAARAVADAASRDEFNRKLADGLRKARASCRAVPAQTGNSASAAPGNVGDDGGRGRDDPAGSGEFREIRDTMKELQRDALAGMAFAKVCGR